MRSSNTPTSECSFIKSSWCNYGETDIRELRASGRPRSCSGTTNLEDAPVRQAELLAVEPGFQADIARVGDLAAAALGPANDLQHHMVFLVFLVRAITGDDAICVALDQHEMVVDERQRAVFEPVEIAFGRPTYLKS